MPLPIAWYQAASSHDPEIALFFAQRGLTCVQWRAMTVQQRYDRAVAALWPTRVGASLPPSMREAAIRFALRIDAHCTRVAVSYPVLLTAPWPVYGWRTPVWGGWRSDGSWGGHRGYGSRGRR
jgi:hypothetical protein